MPASAIIPKGNAAIIPINIPTSQQAATNKRSAYPIFSTVLSPYESFLYNPLNKKLSRAVYRVGYSQMLVRLIYPKLSTFLFKHKFTAILSIGNGVFPRIASMKSEGRKRFGEESAVHFTEQFC